MSEFKVGDKLYGFLGNLLNDCTLDILHIRTIFLHLWEILSIEDSGSNDPDIKILMVKDVIGMVIPRKTLSDCLYKTKEEAIDAMIARLEVLKND
jgi:hypothetical protein